MKKIKILILDDEEMVCKIVRNILTDRGFETREANSIIEATTYVETEHFDIVLCDIFLGEKDSGLDFLKYCIKNKKDTGFIMITGSSNHELSLEAIELGVHGYMIKPFNENQLLITVDNCLKRIELEKKAKSQLENLDHIVKDKTAILSEKIKELEETKKRLQESEETFRSIFENMQEGFYRTDELGRITMFNPATKRITGYEDYELIGMNIISLYHKPEEREVILKKLYEKGRLSNIETVIRKRDGSLITVIAASNVLYDDSGNISGIEGVFHDISERVALEAQIAESRKLRAIGKLAAGIAHEINTPTQYVGDNTLFLKDSFGDIISIFSFLNHFIGNMEETGQLSNSLNELKELLIEKDVEYLIEEIPKAIDQSLDGIERVTGIVGSMKKFSHPNEEKVDINLNSSIKDTVTVSKHEWKYVADLKLDLDENLPMVSCYSGELNQVILNIIVNASHAISDVVGETGKKGLITISTSEEEKSIEIRISDTGKGIEDKNREHVFDPFFTTKGIGKGTGQGLAIAKSVIVEKHGGSIEFETTPGRGTVFIIKIPK